LKFLLGLVTGVALGAVATYLALERPWQAPAKPPPEVAVGTPPPVDAGPSPRKGKRRTGRTTTPAGTVERQVDDDLVLSAADRALEWRGDAVALPPRTIDLGGAGDDGRPLDDGEIQGAVGRGARAMVDCVAGAAGGAPLVATITVSMLVGGDGAVQKLRVRAPRYLHEHGLLACARGAARGLPFPATGAPTVVTVPFVLN
jgi:hypothetical protein